MNIKLIPLIVLAVVLMLGGCRNRARLIEATDTTTGAPTDVVATETPEPAQIQDTTPPQPASVGAGAVSNSGALDTFAAVSAGLLFVLGCGAVVWILCAVWGRYLMGRYSNIYGDNNQ